MVNYIVYNKITGDILRTGSCPKSMMNIQAINENENETVIEGRADDVCDVVFHSTKVIIKDFKTSRQIIQEEEERRRIEEVPIKEKETLIKKKIRQIAIDELVKEGKL